MRVLIIGAGVAGLTAAGLLRTEQIEAQVVEEETQAGFNSTGYMLGLLPLGGRVLSQLGLRERYEATSVQMDRYRVHAGDGSMLHDYPLRFINETYGSYRGISRQELVETLLGSIDTRKVRFGTTVEEFDVTGPRPSVTFSDGTTAQYDLVIGADGLHSKTRAQLVDPSLVDTVDTGWGGWVTWLDADPEPAYDEYWGSGAFLGLYPVRHRTGVFLGGPVAEIEEVGRQAFASKVAARLKEDQPAARRAIDAVAAADDPYFWQFADCRSEQWWHHGVVLLGDAAVGFLPTAGVGASMAMDSAAALVDELSRADPDHLDYSLKLFEQRQRSRVERAQEDSRRLGKIMFVRSRLVTALRDRVLPFYSLERMLSDIGKVMQGT